MIVIPFELTQSRNTRELEVNVCMEEDTIIPARSRWMYKAALRGQAAATIRSGDHGIVARDDLLARHPLLQLGESGVEVRDGCVVVSLLNLAETDQVLK